MQLPSTAADDSTLQPTTIFDESGLPEYGTPSALPLHFGAVKVRLPCGSPETSVHGQKRTIGSDQQSSSALSSTSSPTSPCIITREVADSSAQHQSPLPFPEVNLPKSSTYSTSHIKGKEDKLLASSDVDPVSSVLQEEQDSMETPTREISHVQPTHQHVSDQSQGIEAARQRYRREKGNAINHHSEPKVFPPRSSYGSGRNPRTWDSAPAKESANMVFKGERNRASPVFPLYGTDDRNFRATPRQYSSITQPTRPARNHGRSNDEAWRTWKEVSVKIHDIPAETTTKDLYLCFSKEGTLISIDLHENARGEREGRATIKFCPPPSNPFWEKVPYQVHTASQGPVNTRPILESFKRPFLHPSPMNVSRKYEESMVLTSDSLGFGMMYSPASMLDLCTVFSSNENDIRFGVNLKYREITVEFILDIRDSRTASKNSERSHVGKHDREERFKFRIPFSQLKVINQIETSSDQLVLLLSLETPPKYFRKVDPQGTHEANSKYWADKDTWYRQTDVFYSHKALRLPLTLRKPKPVIDFGRWTTYRLSFSKAQQSSDLYRQIYAALQDYNIAIKPFGRLEQANLTEPLIWKFFDKPMPVNRSFENELIELTHEAPPDIASQVRYQLDVCISNGYLNEHNLGHAFLTRLATMGVGEAQDLLEYVANHAKRVFDVMSLFDLKLTEGTALRAKIPYYCEYIRSATITPTAVYFQTPIPETSNRVIRKYAHHADRFLRVRFTEEKDEGAIYATDESTSNEVFSRVKRVLTNGIVVGGRKYEFLACGNSQFREHGAYFFAPLPLLPTEKIRQWMGMFSDIETVPLYLARLGQCFSTTRAVFTVKPKIKELPDIERNGFNFSDGVGKMSRSLAQCVAAELRISTQSGEAPSVFQIRSGGCKGILAVDDKLSDMEIYVRRSQYKFPAKDENLEIIRWSQFASANLNRQIILVLSALGVPDEVFSRKLQLQLSDLELAMTDEMTALAILQKDIDPNQMTLVLAGMILDGFQKTMEPFMASLLHLWRAWSLKYLKEKARITIGSGAFLYGCVDETAILKGHYNNTPILPDDAPIEEKAQNVPQVFVQVARNADDKPEVILGPMLVARNPSLHPGDIRVVCGVDVPELHHLKDVVVFPQTGDRDIASMCSGGDLDGDDFLVIWDRDLLPHQWNAEPMDYSRPKIDVHGREIGIDDLTSFFVTYMKNDTVSRIAVAHLANADDLEEGVKDPKCLELANLHSMAVDYVKTGQPAHMSRDLKARRRPHFMDNTHQRKENIYISRKVLGQLYDQVERVDFVPAYTDRFDDRILCAYELDGTLLHSAGEIKQEYDAHLRRIMAQHDIHTEFEVWSTFVLEHSRITNDYKFHEQIGQISSALKDHFRPMCFERAGGKDFERIGPFAAAMYKVTATEMTLAAEECCQTELIGGREKPKRRMIVAEMPLMSFPWLFHDVLGRIAKEDHGQRTFRTSGASVCGSRGFEERFLEAERD